MVAGLNSERTSHQSGQEERGEVGTTSREYGPVQATGEDLISRAGYAALRSSGILVDEGSNQKILNRGGVERYTFC